MSQFIKLPDMCVRHILGFLLGDERYLVQRVCKLFKELSPVLDLSFTGCSYHRPFDYAVSHIRHIIVHATPSSIYSIPYRDPQYQGDKALLRWSGGINARGRMVVCVYEKPSYNLHGETYKITHDDLQIITNRVKEWTGRNIGLIYID